MFRSGRTGRVPFAKDRRGGGSCSQAVPKNRGTTACGRARVKSKPALLVTGGAGYVGSHAILALLNDYEVVILDNLSQGRPELVAGKSELVVGDILDAAALRSVLSMRSFAGVLHFAGLACVGESSADPAHYYRTNVTGTLQLLAAMRAARVPRLVFSSSCAVYGVPRTIPISEDAPTVPVNPYGETKLVVEKMLAWYEQAYGLRYAALRYFNAAGADLAGRIGEIHQPEQHVIPRLLRCAANRDEFIVNGTDYATPDGTCVRDYVHVADLAEAHVLAIGKLLHDGPSQTLNLAGGSGVSVLQLAAAAESVTGRPIRLTAGPRRLGDPPALIADASRAQAALGWSPHHSSIEEILRTAWRWQLRHTDMLKGLQLPQPLR